VALFDRKGLVTADREALHDYQRPFAQRHAAIADFVGAMGGLRPTGIIGLSTVGGAFDQHVIEAMARVNERPMIFAYSNPTSRSECTAEQAYTWSAGRAVFAGGSPFPPVRFGDRTFVPGQGNNVYVFPAIGMAVYATGAGREVKVTNLDKVFFPKMGLTKGDLIQYYVDVADAVPHHVSRRPMQMKRHPNGVEGDFFYQKRVPMPHPEWLETVHINYPSGNEADFPVVTDPAGLAWIANLGCIELHTWHSRVPEVNKPDYLLIDLDPSEGNPWAHVREIAMAGKRVMDDLGLPCYPKTSGVTGLHILIPILPELE